MKKRLLSAALALAMVLTLLPVSAFAADTISSVESAAGQQVTYYKSDADMGNNLKAPNDGWYFNDGNGSAASNWKQVTKGCVSTGGSYGYNYGYGYGGSDSGTWYGNISDAITAGATYIKLIDSIGGAGADVWIENGANITIDLCGKSIATTTTFTVKANSTLNLTDTSVTAPTRTSLGSITAIKLENGSTLSATNVNFGSTATITAAFSSSAKVELINSSVAKEITLTGTPDSANNGTSCSGGEVVLDNSTVSSKITISHDAGAGTSSGGSIELRNRSQANYLVVEHKTSGTSSGGSISVSNSSSIDARVQSQSGGKYTAVDATGTSVNLIGCETELTAEGSTLTDILIFGTGSKTVADSHPGAPKVTLSKGTHATKIIKSTTFSDTEEKLSNPYEITLTDADLSGAFTLDYAKLNVTRGKIMGDTTLKGGEINLTGDGITMDDIILGDTAAGPDVTLNATGTNITIASVNAGSNTQRKVTFTTGASDTNKFGTTGGSTGSKASVDLGPKYTFNLQGGNFNGYLPLDYTTGLPYCVIDPSRTPNTYSYYRAEQMNDLVSRYQSSTNPNDLIVYMDSVTTTTLGDVSGKNESVKMLRLRDDRDGTEKTLLRVYFNGKEPKTFILPTKVSNMNSVQWVRKLWEKDEAGKWVEKEVLDVYTGGSAFNPTAKDYDSNMGAEGGYTESPENTITLYVQSADYSVNQINRVWANPDPATGHRVTATLGGNRVITLTGNLGIASGTALIPLVLETDAGNVEVNVSQMISGNTRSTTFVKGSVKPVGAMTVSDDGKTLRVGNIAYTLDGSAVKTKIKDLKDGTPQIVTTVTSSVDRTDKGRIDLGKSMTSEGADVFNFTASPAVLQALGRIEAGISESDLAGWMKEAQQKAWEKRPANKGKTPTEGDLKTTGYDTVYLVPYLDVQLTSWNPNAPTGLLTATMVPSYKIEVRSNNGEYNELYKYSNAANYASTGWKDAELEPLNGAIVIRKGSLGALSSDFGEVSIKLNVPDFNSTEIIYAHQGSTYVSSVTKTAGSPVIASFTLYHTAVSGEGLGVVQLNTQKPLVTLKRDANNLKIAGVKDDLTYDVLQAAVNDALNGDTIYLDDGYKNNQTDTITVTGRARQFTIYARGNTSISAAKGATGVTVTPSTTDTGTSTTGRTYTVQLARDNYVTTDPDKKPEEEEKNTVSIYVSPVSNGSASASASSAKAGDTITVSVAPASGYSASGLTIRTNTGASVSYTTVGTNTYRFTVPTGCTSITVTPAFVRVNTGILITVSNTTYGTATTSAGDSRVAVGSTVSVTVSPITGYRTMGLYVTSDTGATATAYRTGVNTFTFTVPNATSSVVVTPRFDRDNGTIFEDVWSTDYYSSSVGWAVRQGVTDGTDTYHFSPGQTCNRVQMVTFLWRAAGRPSTAGMANPFYDVSPSMGNDFYNAILWANAKGITNGDGSTTRFNPYKTVTRAEAVTFLWRYEGKPAASTNSGFYDVPAREWYAQAVTWAVGKGITNGDGSTTRFNPNGACLRAQIVTFLYRDITGTRA